MEENLRIADLITAYLQGRLSEQDEKELNYWLNEKPENRVLFEKIINEQSLESDLVSLQSFDSAQALDKIKQYPQLRNTYKIRNLRWPRIAAAASIALALSAGGYFLVHKNASVTQTAQNQQQDIVPGSNKAILTLGNGQRIVLNTQSNGVIASLSNVRITKIDSGKLAYSAGANPVVAMNTLETPRGGTYYVILSDGSKVWLNAASKIIYPSVFKGNERLVTLTGEAYFEIDYNAKMPFKVKINNQVVEDLGTHFNVKAYNDGGPIKTTLFEGGVKVSENDRSIILKPGQQAAGLDLVKEPDLDQAIAWHKGLFEFNNADIPTIMKELSRWYDVDITYEGNIPERHFTGKLYRNVNALKIADILNYNNIHFRIEGKKIIVTP